MCIIDCSSDVCSSDLRQQLMTQQGLTTEPLSKQTNYCPADLILAIAASHKVSLEFQSEVIEKKEFDVYLHEFPATQIQAALVTLIQEAYLRDDPYHPRDATRDRKRVVQGKGV